MTPPLPAARPRFSLSEQPPAGRQALALAALWLAVAVVTAWAAASVAIAVSITAVRLLAALALVALSTMALMLASDSVERWLEGQGRDWARWLQWLTTSIVALAVVVVLGALVPLFLGALLTSSAPGRSGTSNVAFALLVDLLVGALAGALAIGLTLLSTAVLGRAISWVQRRLGAPERAKKWNPPAHAPKRSSRDLPRGVKRWSRDLLRGVLLGVVGLLLSALYTAVVTPHHSGPADTQVRSEPSVWLAVVLPVLFWFLGTGIAWRWFPHRKGEAVTPHRRLRHGTHASALAVCLLIGAAWISAGDVERQARQQLWSPITTTVPAVPVSDQQAIRESPYLAQQFEPLLQLSSGERWDPTAITWYMTHNAAPHTQPPLCNTGGGCYQISPSCDEADPGPCAVSGADDPALYYRYVDASNLSGKDQAPSASGGAWTVIEYWIFYNYDSLHTWAVTQWHQADWEQVSVLVQRRGKSVRPIEVGFSEHCYGASMPAARVEWNRSHPVVFVARGSHANYPRPVSVPVRQLRCSLGVTPRYLGAAGLFFSPTIDGSRLEIPPAYLVGLRDVADARRPTTALKLPSLHNANELPSRVGYWGLDNNLSPLQIGRLRSSAGPPAPQRQGPWDQPFKSMFCNDRWLSEDPRAVSAWMCRSR
jgi:hypothetical protein